MRLISDVSGQNPAYSLMLEAEGARGFRKLRHSISAKVKELTAAE